MRQASAPPLPPWHIPSRKLLDYLIVFIVEGAGRFTVGESTFDVGTGTLAWIPPDTIHEMRGATPMHVLFVHCDLVYDPARSHWDACIPGDTVDLTPWLDLMHPLLDDPEISRWRGELSVNNGPSIRDVMGRLCLEHTRSPATRSVLLSALVVELVDTIEAGLTAPAAGEPPRTRSVESAQEFLRSAADREVDFSRLALGHGLSDAHFRLLFRGSTGMSPREFHQRERMRRACGMLVYSGRNVSEVARAMGYSTVHNFSRAFSSAMGMCPTRYRG